MLGIPRDTTTRRPATTLGQVDPLEDRVVPALFANSDLYSVDLGRVLTVPASAGVNTNSEGGVLANDFSDTFPGQVLTATLVGLPRYVGSNIPLPGTGQVNGVLTTSLFLNPDGSFTFVAPQPGQVPPGVSKVQFTYQVTNNSDLPATGTVVINLSAQPQKLIAVGADAGGGPHVRVYESNTSVLRFNFFPYESTFTGGVRVAVGDLTNDGVDDIATIPATGGAPRLRVFDGADGATILDTFAFDPNFRGGGYVAIGDFNGDLQNDIIIGAGEGGGPRVQVLSFNAAAGNAIAVVADFFAYDPNAGQFGVRVAAGDLENLDRDFIVTAPGQGGGPEVRVFDGQRVIPRAQPGTAAPATRAFFAGDTLNRAGVYVAVGDFNGLAQADIVTGTGSGTPIVRVFSGRNSALIREFTIPGDETPTGAGIANGPSTFPFQNPPTGSLLAPATAPSSLVQASVGGGVTAAGFGNGGVRVATTDYNQDGAADIVVGAGLGAAPRARVINSVTGAEIVNILAFSGTFLGGVNVAAD